MADNKFIDGIYNPHHRHSALEHQSSVNYDLRYRCDVMPKLMPALVSNEKQPKAPRLLGVASVRDRFYLAKHHRVNPAFSFLAFSFLKARSPRQ